MGLFTHIKKVVLFLAILICFQSINAQMLDIAGSYIFPDNSIFNEKFIKEKKIRTITMNVSTKRDNQIIKTDGLTYQYEFNPQGKIIKKTTIYYKKGSNSDSTKIIDEKSILDKTSVLYLYNDSTWLITRRSNERFGTFSYNFAFNKYGNVKRQSYTKDDIRSFISYDYKYDKSGNIIKDKEYEKKPFELSTHDTIFYETYDFDIINDTKFRMTCFNNDDKIYKEVTILIDSTSNIIKVSTEYAITNKTSYYSYTYNSNKKIIRRNDYSDLFTKTYSVTSYTHDDTNGNVIEENVTVNDQPSTLIQYLYDSNQLFLETQLTKNIATNSIEIIKYSYQFYE